MAVFDFYVMVDWSGGNSRSANRANCIWMAHGARDDQQPITESPRSRTEAAERISQLALQFFESHKHGRMLACLDFAFGYPRGFASHIPVQNAIQPLWCRVWEYLSCHVNDDIGTNPGKSTPTNRSNRFDVANELNGLTGNLESLGPFWCADPNWRRKAVNAGKSVHLPQTMPHKFVTARGVTIPQYRMSDTHVKGDFPFRLFGNGSVGSQMLTGIPRLQSLRQSPVLQKLCKPSVWPFETGWATDDVDPWLDPEVKMVLAEIYPSVRKPLPDVIQDRGQVRAMWQWARELDSDDHLRLRFARPEGLSDDDEVVVQGEEGWILH